jgi:hypothetical protein
MPDHALIPMKKILLILLLLPTLLFAQDKAKPTLIAKLENCNVTVNGKYRDRDTIPVAEIGQLVVDCGTVVSFNLSFPVSGTYITDHANGNRFSPSIGTLIVKSNSQYTYLVITDIEYKTIDGQIKHARGITIVAKK